MPVDFNFAYLALLPKATAGDMESGGFWPLSLANTEGKLFASALSALLAPAAERVLAPVRFLAWGVYSFAGRPGRGRHDPHFGGALARSGGIV